MKIKRPEESEKALLSICMNYPNKADEVIATVESHMFNYHHRRIFNIICDIVTKGGEPTIDVLVQSLPDDLIVTASGINGVFASPTQIEYHAKKIFDFMTRTKLKEIYAAIPDIVNNASIDTDEMVGQLESQLISLSKAKFQGYVSGREIALKTIEAMELARKGELNYPMSGLQTLDNTVHGFKPGKLYIIGARPGMGKTALTVTMIRNMNASGVKVGLFSSEMDATSIAFRYIAVDSNMPIDRVEAGTLNTPIMASLDRLGENENIFVNDTPNISLQALIRDAKTMKRRENVQILFVDYISLIKVSGEAARHEKVGLVSKRLKELSRELEIPVVALSQLTRDTQKVRPTIANIRYSGEIEEDADCIMLLFSENETAADIQPVECIVAKHRGGAVGSAALEFRKTMTKFFSKD